MVKFVGGCVRDYYLGLPIKDIDLATIHAPAIVTKLLKGNFKIIPTGIDHGTLTIVTKQHSIQITTLRRDVNADGRHADVSFTGDWRDDAMRRDFTINTLLMDDNGKLYDPLGIGLRDLKKQSVIFVGNAEMRVREDYLRILRYVRFAARFSKGKLKPNYLNIFAKQRQGFNTLSIERITDEILKIIILPFGLKALQNFEVTKLLPLPKLSDRSIIAHKKIIKFDIISHSLLLALWSDGKIARWNKINQYLRLPKAMQVECVSIIEGIKILKTYSEHEYKLLLYKYGYEIAETILLFDISIKNRNVNTIKTVIKSLRSLTIPVFKISGKDLIKQGMKPGPEMGAILKRLEQRWIQSNFDDRLLNLTNLT